MHDSLALLQEKTGKQLNDLACTGTTAVLDAFRSGSIVQRSGGQVRPGTEGAHVKRMFCKLPGFSAGLARRCVPRCRKRPLQLLSHTSRSAAKVRSFS